MKHIVAHTPPGSTPPYLNISADDDDVRITVRSPADHPHYPGAMGVIHIERSAAISLLREAIDNLESEL